MGLSLQAAEAWVRNQRSDFREVELARILHLNEQSRMIINHVNLQGLLATRSLRRRLEDYEAQGMTLRELEAMTR